MYAILPAGTYYLVLDTWADANDTPWTGAYTIRVSIRERGLTEAHMMNSYVLAAVDYLYAEYGLLGYGAAALTHDIPYGEYGSVPKSGGALTMCVAAAMEVILQAMILYAEDTGDTAVFDFLPLQSWKSLAPQNIRAHIWVNHEIGTWGTADALVNFGMGITLPFEELRPGAFINLNRTNGTGHAVVLISFIDKHGREYDTWNDRVIGFKYFSSQGGSAIDTGGLDYRYAIFSEHGKLTMPYKRDTGVIYSTNPHYLNTGELLGPWHWGDTDVESWVGGAPSSAFDPAYFNGWTIDDVPSL